MRKSRPLSITPADRERIEAIRDRCARRTTAGEAVRVAFLWWDNLGQTDITQQTDALAQEGSPDVIFSAAMLPEEDAQLTAALQRPLVGLKRVFSRSELMRAAILAFYQQVPEAQAAALWRELPKMQRGPKPTQT